MVRINPEKSNFFVEMKIGFPPFHYFNFSLIRKSNLHLIQIGSILEFRAINGLDVIDGSELSEAHWSFAYFVASLDCFIFFSNFHPFNPSNFYELENCHSIFIARKNNHQLYL